MAISERLRVAVLGCGRMGRHHARVYSTLENCELVAVVDKDPERAKEVAALSNTEALTRFDQLTGKLDAVSVAVPTVYHAEVAIPLIERGIPVLVEKPLAPDTHSARQLLEASRKHNCLLQVGHSERFNPVVQAMLRLNVKPRFIETQRVSPFTFRSADIGVVFDMMIHDIDIVLHLVHEATKQAGLPGHGATEGSDVATKRRSDEGRGTIRADRMDTKSPNHQMAKSAIHNPDSIDNRQQQTGSPATIDNPKQSAGRADYEIDAIGVNVLGEFEDVANARVRFSEGTVANLTASRLALKTDRRIRVFCPTAYITMDYQKKSGIAVQLADNLDLIRMARERNFEDLSQMASLDFGSMVKIEPLVVNDVEPLRAEIEAFLSAVGTGSESGVSAEEGYAAVEMAERITKAVLAGGLTIRT